MTKQDNLNITEYDFSEGMEGVLRGHIFIDSLLEHLLLKKLERPEELELGRISFYQKVKFLLSIGVIEPEISEVLLSLNNLRNDYAHELNYEVEFRRIFEIVNEAMDAGVDFTSEKLYRDYQKAKDGVGINCLIWEAFSNTYHHLLRVNKEMFSEEEYTQFLA